MSTAARSRTSRWALLAGIVAGAIAHMIFGQVWKRVAHDDEAPDALEQEYLAEVVLAAALQGQYSRWSERHQPGWCGGVPQGHRKLAGD